MSMRKSADLLMTEMTGNRRVMSDDMCVCLFSR